jgi:hypothetical protein
MDPGDPGSIRELIIMLEKYIFPSHGSYITREFTFQSFLNPLEEVPFGE